MTAFSCSHSLCYYPYNTDPCNNIFIILIIHKYINNYNNIIHNFKWENPQLYLLICQRLYHCSHLYGSNRSWMSLKDSNWCTSSKTPYSHNFITAACSNESIFIVNSHVGNFSRVPSKCSKEASIICSPDFHQAVIWTLQQHKRQKIYI